MLASCDATRELLESRGVELIDHLVERVAQFKSRIQSEMGVEEGVFLETQDPTKVVLCAHALGARGVDLERELLKGTISGKRVTCEMADNDFVVFVMTVADSDADVLDLGNDLVAALRAVGAPASFRSPVPSLSWSVAPRARATLREAFFGAWEMVPAHAAAGRISSDLIAVYPPGVACIAPGEELTADMVAAMHATKESGARIAYATDSSLTAFRVVKE